MAAALVALAAASFALQAYSIVEEAKAAGERAKLQREDIALQRESMRLNEQARKIKEVMAEAKVKKDLRQAQAKLLVRQTISGVDTSSTFEAMTYGMEAEVSGGIAVQRELAGISTEQSKLAEQRLDVTASMISEPSDLDVMLNIVGAGIGAGSTIYAGYKSQPAKKYTTDYSIPMQSMDFDYGD